MAQLVRARNGKMLGGVCAGIAQRYGLSASTVRAIFVVSCLLPGPQFVIYLILWLALPQG